jgi:general stress protein YciG
MAKSTRRGFAGMPPEKRREAGQRGGQTSHARGTAHTWTPAEAQRAGKMGGSISRRGPSEKVAWPE